VASASSYSSAYAPAIENVPYITPAFLRESRTELIRADMVFWPRADEGAVFSVSAISWCGSLSYNNYSNNVARISENVLRRFLDPSPLPSASAND
jgi:N,N-dimethylformamidase